MNRVLAPGCYFIAEAQGEDSEQFESKLRWLVAESRAQQYTAAKLDTTYFATAKELRYGG